MTVIDTFDAAQAFLKSCCSSSAEEALAEWERNISAWPSLRKLCQSEYGDNWREVFFSHVLPRLCRSIEKMQMAHDNLLTVLPSVTERCVNFFGCVGEVNIVVYIGLGNGAGWVTEYDGEPAILFGLENIADLDWTDVASLQYLVAHESVTLRTKNYAGSGNGRIYCREQLRTAPSGCTSKGSPSAIKN